MVLISDWVVPQPDDRLDPRLDLLGLRHDPCWRRQSSGNGRTNPQSPSASGIPPRSEPITGMPLIIASIGHQRLVLPPERGQQGDPGQALELAGIVGIGHDLDVDRGIPAQAASGQASGGPPALDHQERDIGPAAAQLVGDPDERADAFLRRRVDERDEPRLGGSRPGRGWDRRGSAAAGTRVPSILV